MIDLELHQRVLHKRADVGEGEVGGALLLFSSTERRLHQLNPTAAAIWRAVDETRTVADVVDAVAAAYDVDSPTIEPDVCEVLMRLRDGGLLLDDRDAQDRLPPARRSRIPGPASDSVRIGPIAALDTTLFIDVDHSAPEAAMLATLLEHAVAPLAAQHGSRIELDRSAGTVALLEARHHGDGWTVIRNDSEVVSRATRDRAVRTLLAEVNAIALEGMTNALVFHAAAIEFPAGVVLFPGVSNAGKSTLAAQLIGRGHGYLTDEAAAITASGEVHPFHKSLCLEHGAQALLPTLAPRHGGTSGVWDVDPRSIGPGRLSDGGALAGIVFPRFCGGSDVGLRALAPIEAIELLLANAFDFAELGAEAFERLAQLAISMPCHALDHGGQPETLTMLERRFGSVS